MMTLVIAAILLAVGVPSYRAVLQNSRASALASDLTSGINVARAEAIRRGAAVQLCPSSDGATCTGTWIDGWIVSVVSDGEVLRVWSAPTPGSVITQTPTANAVLAFGALGQLTSGDTNIVASVDGCTSERARNLSLASSGRVSVSRAICP
ncbi:GspH/FimT family pseudopilin [Congregibacter variabilis]|uniref:GspH/FimT family pseudopilin n=1 Tax=Congregibacter variabilis TaxID=3081200 RepID=UPI00388E2D8B